MRWLSVIILLLLFTLTACSPATPQEAAPSDTPTETPSALATTNDPSEKKIAEPLPSSAAIIIPAREVELVAKTLRGECYDDQLDDKRDVVRVICNRVAERSFGSSIEAVITAPHQFAGYHDDNEPTASDYVIAHEILEQWYGGGCKPLGEYLYFSSGSDHKNVFSKEWRLTNG
jgi:hypothetical protein